MMDTSMRVHSPLERGPLRPTAMVAGFDREPGSNYGHFGPVLLKTRSFLRRASSQPTRSVPLAFSISCGHRRWLSASRIKQSTGRRKASIPAVHSLIKQ